MDAFKILTAGARFDRRRFKQDIQAFEVSPKRFTQVVPKSQTTRVASTSTALPAELDFFGNVTAPPESTETASKKRKKSKSNNQQQQQQPPEAPDYATLLRTKRIKCTGDDVPNPIPSWSHLPQNAQTTLLHSNWTTKMRLNEPTGIQMSAWGIMLENRDLLACAPTGSGKTLSFLVPLLLSVPPSTSDDPSTKQGPIAPRAIILEPTRELAMQVQREALALSQGGRWKIRVLGEDGVGVGQKPEKKNKKRSKAEKKAGKEGSKTTEEGAEEAELLLEEKQEEEGGVVEILISTPLRLIYAIKSSQVSVVGTSHLILDESDKLFELNFLAQTDEIISHLTSTTQKAMFSATLPSSIEELAKTVMKPSLIRAIVGHKDAANDQIDQTLLFVGAEDHKLLSLRTLIAQGQFTPPVLIFVQSILRAKELATELVLDGINVDTIHAERTAAERDAAVQAFAQGKVWCLIATDVLGRGVDFRGVKLVINYDFPQSAGSYVHRIGEANGSSWEPRQSHYILHSSGRSLPEDSTLSFSIVNVMRSSGCAVPSYMLDLKAPSQDDKKRLRLTPVGRKDISRTNGSGNKDARDRKGKKRERIMGGEEGVFKKRKEKVQIEE
ncbi:BZ3500_MvSof-1268-A1-R1_Chr3-1g06171 [Microbotryum saponariae]|uniref:RNA helicase n=1 Tax=Microbotryum saponariae TaxID=289078 RepID=A0A2X0M4K2_9BASI|nr:BZ3500_MvSof-1268-A1-R1_Chr3-1g06171 [Microbotryum saponariae]SDA04045.1 BZ3501_MvSof-1269-A2-R1_Chr3-2g05856 [Microbotryum saponariae]